MGIQEEFEQVAAIVKQLPESPPPSDDDKLMLYALYKQATVGPVTTPRPNRFNTIYRTKWDAWKAVEGKSKEEAMQEYIAKVKELLAAADAAAGESKEEAM
ncbi:Acyl-CoA-binding protein [Carex littledalei]|uniref:Acyl-CoA-binding protein n=1 Tax=Carex littledalei TaxID=544730 RepID=A0A833VKP0_9POAL|nr:Acyl-CoA-binding protein [Carex littledalei]